MRETIIKSLDVLVWIFAGLIAVGSVIAGLIAVGNGQYLGLLIAVGGVLEAVIFAGTFFMFMGVYNNTRRTAEAVEKLAVGR